jgi:hypothetical protein
LRGSPLDGVFVRGDAGFSEAVMEENTEAIRRRVVQKIRDRIPDFDSHVHAVIGEESSETVDILSLQLMDTDTT